MDESKLFLARWRGSIVCLSFVQVFEVTFDWINKVQGDLGRLHTKGYAKCSSIRFKDPSKWRIQSVNDILIRSLVTEKSSWSRLGDLPCVFIDSLDNNIAKHNSNESVPIMVQPRQVYYSSNNWSRVLRFQRELSQISKLPVFRNSHSRSNHRLIGPIKRGPRWSILDFTTPGGFVPTFAH